jgi:signal transduction histidine kinase
MHEASQVPELERELQHATRELQRLRREAAGLRERLREEQASRQELLAVVGHELRTPLTVIAGYARLLLAEEVGALNAEQRRFLGEAQRACQKLDSLVARLLEAVREPAGAVLALESAPLAPLVEEVAAALRPLLERRGLRLAVSMDAAHAYARFDRTALGQVLTNLLGNAIRYAKPRGTIEIAARPVARAGLPFLEVSVADDGPGIAPEDRERVFQPWARGSDPAGGLGLGLAICRRLVEAHGGEIAVCERPGGGARFAFTLPAEAAAA